MGPFPSSVSSASSTDSSLAAVATAVQLLLIGFVLDCVVRLNRWYLVLAGLVAMTLIAGTAAVRRTHKRFPGIWLASIIGHVSRQCDLTPPNLTPCLVTGCEILGRIGRGS
jgi:ABC-type iron transport system FetAB permease component